MKDKKYNQQTKDACVICQIIMKSEGTQSFEIFRNGDFIVFLNLFPYTPGHLMISPLKHNTEFEEFSQEEVTGFGELTQRCLTMLKHFSRTESFNVGWNQGLYAGGSIKHFHIHIVPRYRNELNFIEIIGKTKPVIVSLERTEQMLARYGPFLAGNKTLEELFPRK
ncbi:MAG: HIT family protein [Candidatus Kariarchaeaceae archaeon]